jgi:outer membrane receptor protein involved in Fe transport
MKSMSTNKSMLCSLVALLTMPLFGQTLGEITGEVTDPSGAILVGATVTATNPLTAATRQTVTNSAGNYSFPALQPGTYTVKVEMQGFSAEARNDIELQVQQVARIDFRLRLGDTTQTVEVSGGAPLLTTENATVGTVIENQRIVDLPLNGRNFIQLVSLSPNVTSGFNNGATPTARLGGDRATQAVSISGQRREFINYTLDGISNTDVNFDTYILLPSIDLIQEFKVQTGIYSSEFGRETNQVNVSTKSGTNDYHGTLFEFLRNSAMDARPFAFTKNVPVHSPFKWNQFGFTLGGPVSIPKLFNGKDRLFFASNYEGFRERQQVQSVITTVPAAMRTGNFSQLSTIITDPLNGGAPFPGNIIPSNRLDPIAQKLLLYDPAPNVPGATVANNYLNVTNNSTNKDQYTQRLDFIESTKSSWFARYSGQWEDILTPAISQAGSHLTVQVSQFVLSNTRVFSPTLVNEARVGYNGFHNHLETDLANVLNVNAQAGLTLLTPIPAYAWGVPNVGISNGYTSFGDNIEGPYNNNDETFQGIDTLAWTHGAHSIKFGGEVRRDRFNQTGNTYIRGAFATQNQATGYGPADFDLGYINSLSLAPAGAAVAQLRSTSQAYFIDDSWKIRSNLTVDVGLRYEYFEPWQSKNNGLINVYEPCYDPEPNAPASCHPTLVRVGTGSDFYAGMNIRFDPAIKVAVNNGLLGSGRSLVYPDRNNFAPRLGIAWSPTSNWTVRLGAGYFFVQDQGNALFELTRNIAGRVQSNANTATHNLTFENPIANGGVCGVLPPGIACVTTPQPAANDVHERTGYVLEYLANIQRQLGKSTVLEFGYVGSEGHKLGRYVNYNVPVPSTVGTVLSRTPYPEFAQILQTSYIVNSNYDSATAKLSRRLSGGLTLLSGFTFSKSLDDGSALRGPSSLAQNALCISCEYSLSDFNVKYRFVTSALYELPFGRGHNLLNHGIGNAVLGGWQIGGIGTVQSGLPLNFAIGVDRSNTAVAGSGGTRPNATGVSIISPNPTTAQWFNLAALSEPALGTWGNMGHNVGIGPGIFTIDGSLMKAFYFTERTFLQVRFEAFNSLNHPNFGDPNLTMTSNQINSAGVAIPGTGSFGTITATRLDMRELQGSLKFVF